MYIYTQTPISTYLMYIFGHTWKKSISDINTIYRICYTYTMQDDLMISIYCGFHKHGIYINGFIDFQIFSSTTLVTNISLLWDVVSLI